MRAWVAITLAVALQTSAAAYQHEVWNYETSHVHPLERTPGGGRLLAVNTIDGRLEVFDLRGGVPAPNASIPVGVDPVSVRALSGNEAWVVNHLSDTISIVDLTANNVRRTLVTEDEPCDVVFAGQRAFVSCSQPNTVLVYDLADLDLEPLRIELDGEEPRALAVDPTGQRVYVAFFESGNSSTVLGGGFLITLSPYLVNAVSDPLGPYGGINPPPNAGIEFDPPVGPGLIDPPPMALIVKRNRQGRYLDDNGGDWTDFVSGDLAWRSGRIEGWQLLDHDVAVIDVGTLDVQYADGLMNLNMGLAVHPGGVVTVVGTDARNEVRFEPNLNGTFGQVVGAGFDPEALSTPPLKADLNPHLFYTSPTVGQNLRDLSLGDPRAIVWNQEGTLAYVAGKGSNNVVLFDTTGFRVGLPIEVGEGPTGLVLDDATSHLYVLNHFDASISVVDVGGRVEIARVPFFDPTPVTIQRGRKHLYDTHKTSGLGHLSCASCHVDSRTDRLAWDLGNPQGQSKPIDGQNLLAGEFEDWHPMKGPMLTQTLQDIVGKEPFHWRGDKDGIEDFNGAFTSLLGDDTQLTDEEMQELEDFLATIRIGPNPFRNLDNSLPTALELPGQFTSGINGPGGVPLGVGNAEAGLARFTPEGTGIFCATCHAMPSGVGPNLRLTPMGFADFPAGPNGEAHSGLVGLDGFTNRTLKVAQLRTLYERIGFDREKPTSRLGFGFLHDGSIDTLSTFMVPFGLSTEQEVADMVAFLMCFSGSDLPDGDRELLNRPPGIPSLDSHAAIGKQVTLRGGLEDSAQLLELALLTNLSSAGKVGLVVRGRRGGIQRGFYHLGGNLYQSDVLGELLTQTQIRAQTGPGQEMTWTVVPKGSEIRIGVDRDSDGAFDGDELAAGTDPLDPNDRPCNIVPRAPTDLGIVAIRRNAIDFEWVDQSYNEESFELQARQSPTDAFVTYGVFPANTTSGTATGLVPGDRYQFRIVAINCAGATPGPHIFVDAVSQRWRNQAPTTGMPMSSSLPPR